MKYFLTKTLVVAIILFSTAVQANELTTEQQDSLKKVNQVIQAMQFEESGNFDIVYQNIGANCPYKFKLSTLQLNCLKVLKKLWITSDKQLVQINRDYSPATYQTDPIMAFASSVVVKRERLEDIASLKIVTATTADNGKENNNYIVVLENQNSDHFIMFFDEEITNLKSLFFQTEDTKIQSSITF